MLSIIVHDVVMTSANKLKRTLETSVCILGTFGAGFLVCSGASKPINATLRKPCDVFVAGRHAQIVLSRSYIYVFTLNLKCFVRRQGDPVISEQFD